MGSGIIKKNLKYIPGFRTLTLWKMIVAGLYYLVSILMISSGVGVVLTSLSLPFVVFGIIDVIRKKKTGLPIRNSVISVLIALIVFISGPVITPEIENSNLQPNNRLNTSITTPKEKVSENNASPTPAPTELTTQKDKVKVIRVIDGDTFEIEGGKKVRLIGVDAPESVHPDPNKNTEFGKTASTFTKEKLEGKTVYLEKDVSETDRYGRLLRYVYLQDNTFFNEYLVKEGIANPATFPPDVKYADVFVRAQQYAKENSKGLWATDQKGTQNNTPTPNTSQNAESQPGNSEIYVDANGRGLIKGNINSKGEKIYHLPGGQFYNKTIPEAWFKTEKEASDAGFRRSLR